MGKKVLYGDEGRQKLKRGIDILADAVKVTLGPRGRNVVLKRDYGAPLVTKDGVTVAKEIVLEDELENLGASIVKDVASKTADMAGDGTTTATVLAQKIYSEGMKLIQSGYNPIEVKEGMDLAGERVCNELTNLAITYSKDDELISVATVSANNDSDVGNMVGEAFIKVGKNGLVTLEESKSTESYLKFSEGLEIERGYISPFFINTSEKDEAKLENPYILLVNSEITDMASYIPMLNEVVTKNGSLLIICKDVKEVGLQTLIINKVKNNLKVCAIRVPGHGDACINYLQDIAVATNAIVLDPNQGNSPEDCDISWLGRCSMAKVTATNATLFGVTGSKEDIEARINTITSKIKDATSDFDRLKLQERASKLGGSACTIYVGGNSEIEVLEKKDRVEDAMNAVQSAIEEGIIAGGGSTYLFISHKLKKLRTGNTSKDAGIRIVLEAIKEPFRQIMKNAELSSDSYLSKLHTMKYGKGIDARTGTLVNLIEKGIVDPVKVSRLAIQNAVSIVGTLLTTECVVY